MGIDYQGVKSPFGKLMKYYRKIRLKTQEQLAKQCGLSAGTIRQIEQGGRRDPQFSTVMIISWHLDIDISDLLKAGYALIWDEIERKQEPKLYTARGIRLNIENSRQRKGK